MKTLALSVCISVALFAFFGAVLFCAAPPGSRQLTEGYGVPYSTAVGSAFVVAPAITEVSTRIRQISEPTDRAGIVR